MYNGTGYPSSSIDTKWRNSWLITWSVTRLRRRVPLGEQELLTIQEHMSSSPVVSVVCVTRSLVFCVCFVDSWLSFCAFSFGHCVVCSSLNSLLITPSNPTCSLRTISWAFIPFRNAERIFKFILSICNDVICHCKNSI